MREYLAFFIHTQTENFGKLTKPLLGHGFVMSGVWIWALVLEPLLTIAAMAAYMAVISVVSLIIDKITDVSQFGREYFDRVTSGKPGIYGASYWGLYLFFLLLADIATISPIIYHFA